MRNLDDTQPNVAVNYRSTHTEIPAPPRFLLWGVIGLFVLGIVGVVAGVVIFREVLTPAYQWRVMQTFPFMEALLPRGAPLPTAEAVDQRDLDALLSLSLNAETTPESTDQAVVPTAASPTSPATPEETEAAAADNAIAAAPSATTPPTETPLPTLAPSPTVTPSPAPTEPPAAENTPADASSAIAPRPAAHTLGGFRWEQQDWNNCGPTNITMALSYYAWPEDQQYAASIIRPNREDKNVSPQELVEFVNDQTFVRALARIGGDLELLKTLLYNGFPVIVEVGGNLFEGYEWIGHYRTLAGYNDSAGEFIIYDSFLGATTGGQPVIERYATLDDQWRAFNRIFIVVYEPQREAELQSLMGDLWHSGSAAQHAFETAQTEAQADPNNPFVWFNMGTSLVELGRYEEAATAFDRATQLNLPRRIWWYQFGPYEAYYQTGRYDDVLSITQNNLTNGAEYVEETYYWQGRVYEALGRTQDAINAYNSALRTNQRFTAARQALDSLN